MRKAVQFAGKLPDIIWFMTKCIVGILVIMITVASLAACYLFCAPFLLLANMKQIFNSANH